MAIDMDNEFVPSSELVLDDQDIEIKNENKELSVVDNSNIDEHFEADFETARNTHKNVIEIGEEVMKTLAKVIKETDSPRAVEIMAGLLKSVGDAADRLIDLQLKKKAINTGGDQHVTGNTVNNNIYLSTDELQSLFKIQKEKIIEGEILEEEDESNRNVKED